MIILLKPGDEICEGFGPGPGGVPKCVENFHHVGMLVHTILLLQPVDDLLDPVLVVAELLPEMIGHLPAESLVLLVAVGEDEVGQDLRWGPGVGDDRLPSLQCTEIEVQLGGVFQ